MQVEHANHVQLAHAKCTHTHTQTHTHIYIYIYIYCVSLAKECPWVENCTSLPKRGVGALSSASAFNHKRVSTSCL